MHPSCVRSPGKYPGRARGPNTDADLAFNASGNLSDRLSVLALRQGWVLELQALARKRQEGELSEARPRDTPLLPPAVLTPLLPPAMLTPLLPPAPRDTPLLPPAMLRGPEHQGTAAPETQ